MSEEVNVDDAPMFSDSRGGFDAGSRHKVRGLKAFVGLMVLIGLLLIGFIIYHNILRPAAQTATTSNKDRDDKGLQNSLAKYPFATTPPNAIEQPKPTEVTVTPAAPLTQPAQALTPVTARPAQAAKPELTPEEKALQRRLGGFSGGGDSGAASATAAPAEGTDVAPGAARRMEQMYGGGAAGKRQESASSAFAGRLNAAPHDAVYATMLPHPSLTVPMGTLIPCGTTTELNSTQPGMVGCQVSRDVYSADGQVRLIDKGSNVVGEVAEGIRQGQDRVFVLWTRIRTPDNVVVHLNSPGTNNLGSAGISGQVNRHFWERFGNALLISVIADIGQAAVQRAVNGNQSGGTQVNLGNTQNTGNQMGTEALAATINIPPTLYAEQGKAVGIYVARDLDFSGVYKLQYGNKVSEQN